MRIFSLLLLMACGASKEPADEASQNDVASPDETATEPLPSSCPGDEEPAPELLVGAYVQQVQPESARILWETTAATGSRVDFGLTEELGSVACGEVVSLTSAPVEGEDSLHETELVGLTPDTTYFYRVTSGAWTGELHRFRTAPAPESEASFRLLAIGDSQRDDSHPDVYDELVADGMIPFVQERYGDLHNELAMVLHAGDLVDNGWALNEWREDFLNPSLPFMSSVPLMPVMGNHEGSTPMYFRYFSIPENGGAERYYWLDYSNVRVVGLDSNTANPDQLVWLDGVLADACEAEPIDFVFAVLHHPAQSELWTPGNTDWSAEVESKLDAFATECGKPSVNFFGHTHGYSRGQSRDHDHLMVNVASAGGALDRWGEHPQEDYEAYSHSDDSYGFVAVQFKAGDDPSFTMERISRGHPEAPLDNVVVDSVTVAKNNTPPETPEAVASGCVLESSAFSDADGDAHQATHVQVAESCDFASVRQDTWMQHENVFDGVDRMEGRSLTSVELAGIPGGSACWRVRYRDARMRWSAWSASAAFDAPACP